MRGLYQLTYKARQMVRSGFIEASSLEVADRLGREYCNEGSGRRYIGVVDAILLRENPVEPVQQAIGEPKPTGGKWLGNK